MAIPLWQLGRHLASVVVTPLSVDTAGALTAVTSAAVTLSAYMESLGVQLTNNEEEINSINSTRDNMVGTSDAATLNLSVIKVNNSTDPQPLRTLVLNYLYMQSVWVEGTGGSMKTNTYRGKRSVYDDNFQGRGKQIATLSFSSIDDGSANYAVT